MKMDWSKFKKISSDGKSTTLKHAEGHKIIIAHHALSPKYKKDLANIPNYYSDGEEKEEAQEFAAGGEVKKEEMGPVKPEPTFFEKVGNALSLPGEQDFLAHRDWKKGLEQDKLAMSASREIAQQDPAVAPVAAMTDTSGQSLGLMQGALMQQGRGLEAEAAAIGQQGATEANIARENAAQTEKLMAEYQQNMQKFEAENNAILADIKTKQINPNRYMESRSGLQKILTIIGLAMGGADASKFLDQQIQRDIDSQKADLGKSETLLSYNLKKFGSLNEAMQMTAAMRKSMIADQFMEAAAKAKSPIAAARAQQAAGKLAMEAAPIYAQLAQKSAMNALMKTQGASPEVMINLKVPKEAQKEAREELSMVNGYKKAVKGVNEIFKGIEDIGIISGNMPFSDSKAKAEAAKAQIEGVIRANMKGQGSISDQEMENLRKLLPVPSDTKSQLAQKHAAIQNILSNKVLGGTPTLEGYGIRVDASPPAQEQYKTVNGVKYKRGPKGEAIRVN